MTPLSFVDVTSVPCGTCGGPSVSLRSWPDGTYVASCAEHLDEPKQIQVWAEALP